MKKILAIGTSLRKNGNSNTLLQAFIKGAKETGYKVEEVYLSGKNIEFCRGCLTCQKTHKCVIKDDVSNIIDKMAASDVIVFATPIYYYEMSGQMKTLLDRANPLFPSDYRFRDVYLLTSAADDNEKAPLRAESGLEGWLACFNKANLAGSVFAGGITNIGDITNHPALKLAYEMGKEV
jgi:multimeric flavodoxin WrbA